MWREITSFLKVRSLIFKYENPHRGLLFISPREARKLVQQKRKKEKRRKLKVYKLDYSLWTPSFRGCKLVVHSLFFSPSVMMENVSRKFSSEGILMYLPFDNPRLRNLHFFTELWVVLFLLIFFCLTFFSLRAPLCLCSKLHFVMKSFSSTRGVEEENFTPFSQVIMHIPYMSIDVMIKSSFLFFEPEFYSEVS